MVPLAPARVRWPFASRLSARDWMLIACVGVVFATVVGKTAWAYVHTPNAALIDFRAFYCGARVAFHGVDPYLSAPLFKCEAQLQVAGYPTGGIGVPAPLPEALFLILAPLAALPYGLAAGLWLGILLAAILATTLLMADLTGLPVALVGASIGLGEAYTAVGTGNLAPLAVLAIVLAAWYVQKQRYQAAAFAAALSLLEPHLGAPAACALLIWVPQCRRWILAFGGLVAFISVVYLGPHSPLEYVLRVLPAQAKAEAFAWNQYSLTFLLTSLGADAAIASRISSAFFVAILLFSLAVARSVARAVKSDAAIVLFPAAAVMFGGPYVHFAQVIAALPFALLLYSQRPTMGRLAVLVALSTPGYGLLTEPMPAFLLTVATTATMAATMPRLSTRSFLSVVGVTAAAAYVIALVAGIAVRDGFSAGPITTPMAGLASETWRQICWELRMRPQAPLVALVLPVWIALAAIIFRPYPGTLTALALSRLFPRAAKQRDT